MEFIAFELTKLLSLHEMKVLRRRLSGVSGLVVRIDQVLFAAGHKNDWIVHEVFSQEKIHISGVREYRLEQVRKSYA